MAALAVPKRQFNNPHQLATKTGTFIDRDKNLILQIEQLGNVLWAHWFWGPSSIDSELEALVKKRFRWHQEK